MKMILPKYTLVKTHLDKYGQYSTSQSWNTWYAKVAPLKGKRVVQTLLKYKKSNAKVLDLGCGIGLTLMMVGQVFPKTIGCEVDEHYFKASKEILKKLNLKNKVIMYDGKRLPFTDNSFDIVTFIDVIEHVDNQEQVLKEIKRILKPDGILHLTTANKWWPIEPHFKLPFLSYLPKQLADLYVRISGRGDSYQNIRLPSYSEFYKMVSNHFIVQDITLDVIEDFEKYGFGEERGVKVVIAGKFIKILRKTREIIYLSWINSLAEWFLVRISLGWLFIAMPRKKQ